VFIAPKGAIQNYCYDYPISSQNDKERPRFTNDILINIARSTMNKLNVLDYLGFIPFSASTAHALFTFCSEVYEHLS
jgi:hypothetical protein